MRKFIFVCILMVFALSTAFSVSAAAAQKTYASDKIFAISKCGDTREDPASVEESISLGFDAVSVEVSEEGINLSELENMLSIINGRILLIIDCEENNLSSVYSVVKENASLENVFFRSREMKNDKFLAWAENTDKEIQIIPSYDGNVIFSAVSAYNFAEENASQLCEFTSKNRYGVIFSEFFTKRFENVRALSPVCDKDFSGQRNDSLHGWESLLGLGYSAIETENAKEFSEYVSLLNESYLNLERLYSEVKDTDLTLYSSNSTADFEKALKNAEEILTSEKCASQLQINECIEFLELSMEGFEVSEGENEKISVTPMKIFWIAFAIALFLSSQIYLHKKTQKK